MLFNQLQARIRGRQARPRDRFHVRSFRRLLLRQHANVLHRRLRQRQGSARAVALHAPLRDHRPPEIRVVAVRIWPRMRLRSCFGRGTRSRSLAACAAALPYAQDEHSRWCRSISADSRSRCPRPTVATRSARWCDASSTIGPATSASRWWQAAASRSKSVVPRWAGSTRNGSTSCVDRIRQGNTADLLRRATTRRMVSAGNTGGELLDWIATLGVLGGSAATFIEPDAQPPESPRDAHAYAAWRLEIMSVYYINKLFYKLETDKAYLDRFRADPKAVLAELKLTDEEREAILAGDVGKLYVMGVPRLPDEHAVAPGIARSQPRQLSAARARRSGGAEQVLMGRPMTNGNSRMMGTEVCTAASVPCLVRSVDAPRPTTSCRRAGGEGEHRRQARRYRAVELGPRDAAPPHRHIQEALQPQDRGVADAGSLRAPVPDRDRRQQGRRARRLTT